MSSAASLLSWLSHLLFRPSSSVSFSFTWHSPSVHPGWSPGRLHPQWVPHHTQLGPSSDREHQTQHVSPQSHTCPLEGQVSLSFHPLLQPQCLSSVSLGRPPQLSALDCVPSSSLSLYGHHWNFLEYFLCHAIPNTSHFLTVPCSYLPSFQQDSSQRDPPQEVFAAPPAPNPVPSPARACASHLGPQQAGCPHRDT